MSFKENLKAKIKLDRLFRKLLSTIKEPPGQWRLDKVLAQQLLDMTDLEYKKFRDLQLYVRPLGGEVMEVLVFDNELPIYHTTVADVPLRKDPHRQEMFSLRNIRKIMNHHDVLVSKGKESLKRINANALALLDLTYTRDDLEMLVEDARRGLEHKSIAPIRESLDLFFALLDFQEVFLGGPEQNLQIFAGQIFAGPEIDGGAFPAFEHLILFDEETLSLGRKKGALSPQNDSDLA